MLRAQTRQKRTRAQLWSKVYTEWRLHKQVFIQRDVYMNENVYTNICLNSEMSTKWYIRTKSVYTKVLQLEGSTTESANKEILPK